MSITTDTSTDCVTEEYLLEDAPEDEDGEAGAVSSSPGASRVSTPIRVIPATDAQPLVTIRVCCELQPQLTALYCTHCTNCTHYRNK